MRFAQRRGRRAQEAFGQSSDQPMCRSLRISSACLTNGRPIARSSAGSATSLKTIMSEEFADQTLRAVINWARYGEVFAYDEDAGVLSLDNPTAGR